MSDCRHCRLARWDFSMAPLIVRLLLGFCALTTTTVVYAVWNCEEDDTPGPVESYSCNAASTTAKAIGIFMNFGEADVNRSLGNQKYGAEVLKQHEPDYVLLYNEVYEHWKSVYRSLVFEPVQLSTEDRTVTVPKNKTVKVYQASMMCSYYKKKAGALVRNAVKVYSKQLEEPLSDYYGALNLTCDPKDRTVLLSQPQSDLAAYDHASETIPNESDSPLEVSVTFEEGVANLWHPNWSELHRSQKGQQGDDKSQFVSWINSNLSAMTERSIYTGINWLKFKLPPDQYGTKKSQVTISVPHKKKLGLLQPVQFCGHFRIYAPPKFIFLPPTAGKDYEGECESPQIVPLCVTVSYGRLWTDMLAGSPEASLGWRHRSPGRASFKEASGSEKGSESQVKIKYGIVGPFAERVSSGFKQKLKETVIQFGMASNDTWSKSVEMDKAAEKTIPFQKLAGEQPKSFKVYQLVGVLGLYYVYTDQLAFFSKEPTEQCWDAAGETISCNLQME